MSKINRYPFRSQRFNIENPVSAYLFGNPINNRNSIAKNISILGMYLEFNQPHGFRLKTLIEGHADVGLGKNFYFVGRVVRLEDHGGKYGIGVSFSNLDPENLDLLVECLNNLMISQ